MCDCRNKRVIFRIELCCGLFLNFLFYWKLPHVRIYSLCKTQTSMCTVVVGETREIHTSHVRIEHQKWAIIMIMIITIIHEEKENAAQGATDTVIFFIPFIFSFHLSRLIFYHSIQRCFMYDICVTLCTWMEIDDYYYHHHYCYSLLLHQRQQGFISFRLFSKNCWVSNEWQIHAVNIGGNALWWCVKIRKHLCSKICISYLSSKNEIFDVYTLPTVLWKHLS